MPTRETARPLLTLAAVALSVLTASGQAFCIDRYLMLATSTAPGDGSGGFGDGLDLRGMLVAAAGLVAVSLIGVPAAARLGQVAYHFGVGLVLLALETLVSASMWSALPGRSDARVLVVVPVLAALTAVAVLVLPRRRPGGRARGRADARPTRDSADPRRRGVL